MNIASLERLAPFEARVVDLDREIDALEWEIDSHGELSDLALAMAGEIVLSRTAAVRATWLAIGQAESNRLARAIMGDSDESPQEVLLSLHQIRPVYDLVARRRELIAERSLALRDLEEAQGRE